MDAPSSPCGQAWYEKKFFRLRASPAMEEMAAREMMDLHLYHRRPDKNSQLCLLNSVQKGLPLTSFCVQMQQRHAHGSSKNVLDRPLSFFTIQHIIPGRSKLEVLFCFQLSGVVT